jgi:hypothetical protein
LAKDLVSKVVYIEYITPQKRYEGIHSLTEVWPVSPTTLVEEGLREPLQGLYEEDNEKLV